MKNTPDLFQRSQIKVALYQGALAKARSGLSSNNDQLKKLGLSSEQIDGIQREFNKATTGLESSKRERFLEGNRVQLREIGEKVAVEGLGGLNNVGATLKRGAAEALKGPSGREAVARGVGQDRVLD